MRMAPDKPDSTSKVNLPTCRLVHVRLVIACSCVLLSLVKTKLVAQITKKSPHDKNKYNILTIQCQVIVTFVDKILLAIEQGMLYS